MGFDRRSGIGRPNRPIAPREVIEAVPAHVVQNKLEAAYARSDLFDRRDRTETEAKNSARASMPRSRVLPLVTHTRRTDLPSKTAWDNQNRPSSRTAST